MFCLFFLLSLPFLCCDKCAAMQFSHDCSAIATISINVTFSGRGSLAARAFAAVALMAAAVAMNAVSGIKRDRNDVY